MGRAKLSTIKTLGRIWWDAFGGKLYQEFRDTGDEKTAPLDITRTGRYPFSASSKEQ